MDVRVYSPEAFVTTPGRLFAEMLKDLGRSRELAWSLAKRDIKAQYRGAFLGYLWAFITPLVSTALWVFLSASGVIKVAATDIPYPAYVFSGTMLWQMFTEALSSPLNQITSSRSMLAKLNFPREALILAGAYKVTVNALVKLAVLLPVLIFLGVLPDQRLFLLPLALLALLLVGFSVGLLIAPLGTLYTDVGRFMPLFTQLLMYLTPVVFAMPSNGFMARIFLLNPLTPVVVTARSWLTGTPTSMLSYFLGVGAVSLALLLVGWMFYRITMPVLIERMSS